MGGLARLPDPPANGDDGGTVPNGDLYKIAVEEYRFQAMFNWTRTQYLLAFNAAILTAGTVVASRPGNSAALVYLLGLAAAVLSGLAVRTQHEYYRAARDRMRAVEEAVGIAKEQRTDTTSTLGSRPRRVSVNQVVYLLLGALAVADAVGAGIVLMSQ